MFPRAGHSEKKGKRRRKKVGRGSQGRGGERRRGDELGKDTGFKISDHHLFFGVKGGGGVRRACLEAERRGSGNEGGSRTGR